MRSYPFLIAGALFTTGAWAAASIAPIYNFLGPAGWPTTLIFHQGILYGTDIVGANGDGAVFQLTPAAEPGGPWTETAIYNFVPSVDGGGSDSNLAASEDGSLYGTTGGTSSGGPLCGTVFQLKPPAVPGGAWTHSVLYQFSVEPYGDCPVPTSVGFHNGALYVIEEGGGTDNLGTVFQLTPPALSGGA